MKGDSREYRIAYAREDGKRQYKTYQIFASVLRFARTLRAEKPRTDLKPIVYLQCELRAVGAWHNCSTPELDALKLEKVSDPPSMID